MAISFTYDSLVAALIEFTEERSTEFAENIPTIIGLAELQLIRDTKLSIFDQSVDLNTMSIGSPLVTKPAGTVFTRSLGFTNSDGEYAELTLRGLGYCRDYWPVATETDVPVYYAERDEEKWYLAPTPDDTYAVECVVAVRPDGLSESNQTTWFGSYLGDALFWACLANSEAYLIDDERVQVWKDKYQNETLPAALQELIGMQRVDYNPILETPEPDKPQKPK